MNAALHEALAELVGRHKALTKILPSRPWPDPPPPVLVDTRAMALPLGNGKMHVEVQFADPALRVRQVRVIVIDGSET